MRIDIITFGQYKDHYWEDVDIDYIEWVSKNHVDKSIVNIANHWLAKRDSELEELKRNKISTAKETPSTALDSTINIIGSKSQEFTIDGLTKDSHHLVVLLLGNDNARTLAENILEITRGEDY